MENIPTRMNPQQTYALYLPPDYAPERTWPIVYAFDPVARGSLAVGLLKDAAARYGYIVVASNNSRNGPVEERLVAAQAVWDDTHARFSLDPRRVYVSGFSGGARLATFLALACQGCIVGVIAQGAGRPLREDFSSRVPFGYFGVVGNLDFNYAEMVEVSSELDALGIANRLRIFRGAHQWAPAEVQLEAVEWLELGAIRAGSLAPDPEFVERQLTQGLSRARALEEVGESLAAYSEYRKLVQDFQGLADVSAPAARAAELEKTEGVQRGRERQQEEIRRQQALAERLARELQVLRLPPAERPLDAVARLRREIRELKNTVARANQESETVVEQRALRGILALAYEEGQAQLEGWGGRKEPAKARAYFELVTEMAPDSQLAFVLLAQAHAGAGERKPALRALQRAVENGFGDAGLLARAEEFSSLRQTREFQELLARAQANAGK